jgi:hypothetical protein
MAEPTIGGVKYRFQADLSDLERGMVSAKAQLTQLEGKAKTTAGALSSGFTAASQQIGTAAGALSSHSNVIHASFEKAGKGAGLASHELKNLSFQLNDAITQLGTGSSAFQVFAAQGGQVFQVLQGSQGGVSGALKEIGSRALGLVTPARLAGGAMFAASAVAVAGLISWQAQIHQLENSLNGLGRRTGLGPLGLANAASAGQALGQGRPFGGVTTGESRDLAGTFARSGISGDVIPGLIGLSKTFAGVTGTGLDEAAARIAQAFADPVKGADDLNKSLGFLDQKTKDAIINFAAIGNVTSAQKTLLEALSKDLSSASEAINSTSKAFRDASEGARNFFSGIGSAVSRAVAPTDQEALAAARSNLSRAQSIANGPLGGIFAGAQDEVKRYAAEVERLEKSIGEREKAAKEKQAKQEADRLSQIQKPIDDLRAQSDLAVKAIRALTLGQRLAAEAEIARTTALQAGLGPLRAEEEAISAVAKARAQANREAFDSIRTAKEQLELAGLKPRERSLKEIEIQRRHDDERFGLDGAGATAGPVIDAAAVGKVADMIIAAALARGIDPNVALKVAKAEGLNGAVGDGGSSFGPFQLHYGGVAGGGNAVPGLGDEFTRKTGLDARDSKTIAEQIAFALDNVLKHGWTAFHGAANSGIGKWQGVGGAAAALNAPGVVSPTDSLNSVGATREALALEGLKKEDLARLKAENDAINARVNSLNLLKDSLGKTTEATATASEKQRLLNEDIRNGIKTTPEMSAAYDELAAKVGKVAAAEADFKQLQEQSKYFSDSLSSGLAEIAVRGANASDVLRSIAQDLASSSIKGILSGTGPFASAGGGLLNNIFSGIGGALGFGGKKATGGPVFGNKTYMVGERGPELFVPHSSGSIIPNHTLAAMGGGGGGAQGGGSYTHAPVYRIDARGAQAGVADQIIAAIEQYDKTLPRRLNGRLQAVQRRGLN